MNNSNQEKVTKTKEDDYKIKDIFAKNSELNVNEIIKRAFLINLKTSK